MWVFTKYGFFSVVSARVGDGARTNPVDPDRMMIRARVRHHLQQLKTRFEPMLGQCDIREFSSSDYAFRVFVDKKSWQTIASELAGEIEYDNFKSEVARHQGAAERRYEQALHEVWSVMYQMQERR